MQSNFRVSLVYRGGLDNEVVLIGNSRAVDSLYAPDIEKATGKKTFQLGYQGMSMELAEILLRDYYERNRAPRLLILEITSLMSGNDLINDLRAYAWHSHRIGQKFSQIDPKGFAFAQLSNLYYFNGEIFIKTLFLLKRTDPYRMGNTEVTVDMLKAIKGRQVWKSRPENLAALRRVIELTKHNGTEVRLLLAPIHPDLYKEVANVAEWVQEIEQWAGPGVKIWNYLNSVVEQKAFINPDHVNYLGSAMLLALLQRDFFFGSENRTNPF